MKVSLVSEEPREAHPRQCRQGNPCQPSGLCARRPSGCRGQGPASPSRPGSASREGGWLRAAGGKRTFRGEGDPPWTPACPAVRTGCPVRCGGSRAGRGGRQEGAGQRQAAWSAAWCLPGEGHVALRDGLLLRGAGSLGGLRRGGSGVTKPRPCTEGLCLAGTEYRCLSRGTVFVVVNKRTFQSLSAKTNNIILTFPSTATYALD